MSTFGWSGSTGFVTCDMAPLLYDWGGWYNYSLGHIPASLINHDVVRLHIIHDFVRLDGQISERKIWVSLGARHGTGRILSSKSLKNVSNQKIWKWGTLKIEIIILLTGAPEWILFQTFEFLFDFEAFPLRIRLCRLRGLWYFRNSRRWRGRRRIY